MLNINKNKCSSKQFITSRFIKQTNFTQSERTMSGLVSISWHVIIQTGTRLCPQQITSVLMMVKQLSACPNVEGFEIRHHFANFTVATTTWLTVAECMYHKLQRISSTCRKHFPILSSFRTYHRVHKQSNMTRRVRLVVQELPTHPEQQCSFRVLLGFVLFDHQFSLYIVICNFVLFVFGI